MDEVLEKFGTTAIVGKDDNNTNFDGLYKNWGRLGNQEERRKELLDIQKSNRNTKLDKFRGILEIVQAQQHNVFQTYKARYRPNIYVAGFNKVSHNYSNVLMMSEWMIEKPEDLMEEWLVAPCPKGVRMLVVATDGSSSMMLRYIVNHKVIKCKECERELGEVKWKGKGKLWKKRIGPLDLSHMEVKSSMLITIVPVFNEGTTKCYTKYGHFRFECHTALPGGNRCDPGYRTQCCVLDCFYSEKLKTMFVLDLLAWNNQPMTDGEAEFRNYWLHSQFAERPSLGMISKRNKLIFEILPKVPCTTESLNEFMMKYPHFKDDVPPLDGLLLYHKRAHYMSGETPLVGWLFPYMVPEVLGEDLTVHKNYMAQKPIDYVNQADFIQKFEQKIIKKDRRSLRSSTMDTTDDDKNEDSEPITESVDEDQKPNDYASKANETMDTELNVEKKLDES